jgi:hypothetical protein
MRCAPRSHTLTFSHPGPIRERVLSIVLRGIALFDEKTDYLNLTGEGPEGGPPRSPTVAALFTLRDSR